MNLPTRGHAVVTSHGTQLDAEEFHVEDTHYGTIRTKGSVHQRRHAFIATAPLVRAVCKAARLAATTVPSRRHSHYSRGA